MEPSNILTVSSTWQYSVMQYIQQHVIRAQEPKHVMRVENELREK